MGRAINPPVFYISASLILLFVVLGVIFTELFEKSITLVNQTVNDYFGWFLILCVNIFLAFTVYIMFSRFGKIRLSADDSKPRYSFFSWMAMLFSAGMGIGLLFYGVAEPMLHYANPPTGEGQTIESAKSAMGITFLHWGFHAWATYIVIGLAVAYFTYRKGYPLSLRYAFSPLAGTKIYVAFGHIVEILAVMGTLFGVATSLGLGAMQINSGLSFLTGIPNSIKVQIVIITIITLMAMTSVVSGVNRGIKWLSIFNIVAGTSLLLFVIFLGPMAFVFKAFVQNIGHFLQNFFHLSFWNSAYMESDWQNKWTIFYWSWWIAWSPYVGIFIARISKGRTIREFIAGVLFIPTILSFLWVTAFGSTGIWMDLQGDGAILAAVENDITTALFHFLNQYPLAALVSGAATIVIISFFVTSSDSGSLVVDMITSGGHPDPPVKQRIFWSILEGAVAATLLIGGGLIALQTAALTMALPFSFVMIILCYSLYKALKSEEASGFVNGNMKKNKGGK